MISLLEDTKEMLSNKTNRARRKAELAMENSLGMRWVRGLKMKIEPLKRLVASLVLTLTACSSDGPLSLSDRSAATMLQRDFNEEACNLLLGQIKFSRETVSWGTGIVAMDTYPVYRAIANKGLVKIHNDRDLSRNFTGWNDWFSLTQSGVQRTATIVLTPEGAKLGALKRFRDTDREFVTFNTGTYRIDKSVSNEAVDLNGEKYRIILGTHVFLVRPEISDALVEAKKPIYSDRRFRVLLKYDAFESKWKLQTLDVGPRNVDFGSQNVPTMMAKLRLTGVR